jgi:hypothetical protein
MTPDEPNEVDSSRHQNTGRNALQLHIATDNPSTPITGCGAAATANRLTVNEPSAIAPWTIRSFRDPTMLHLDNIATTPTNPVTPVIKPTC